MGSSLAIIESTVSVQYNKYLSIDIDHTQVTVTVNYCNMIHDDWWY